MNIPLTPQQQHELDTRAGELPRVVDTRTNAVYVLLPEPEYEALRENLEKERRKQGILAAGPRNSPGRLDEAISRNPARSAPLWSRIIYSRPARLSDARIKFLDTKVVFYDWERLRLVYNAILLGIVLCSMTFFVVSRPLLWHPHYYAFELLGYAILANVCFCVGPVAEGYLCWFGLDRHRARWIVFLVGTFIAAWFAILEMQRFASVRF
jgi:hypothetical protein